MTDLNALADRIEGLEGPDAKIDALIWCALNGKRYAEHWDDDFGEGTKIAYTEPPKRTRIVARKAVPNVTASLDAAMTLADEALQVEVLLDAINNCQSDEHWLRDLPRFVCASALRSKQP